MFRLPPMAKALTPEITWLLITIVTVVLETSSVRATAPAFSNTPTVATLYVNTKVQTTVANITCTDPDKDVTTVSLTGITPTTPCGKCFAVNPCIPAGWCLVFLPSQGTLDYASAPTYDISVKCSANGDTVQQTINVRLIFNKPPRFDPNVLISTVSVTSTKNKASGSLVAKLNAVDDDGDAIFYSMTSVPASDNFEIGETNGEIRAKNPLSKECRSSITFQVNITDKINNPVGPHTVQVALNGNNEAPDITNLDKSVQVPEDTAVGYVISAMSPTDDDPVSSLTYTLTASPPANLAYFKVNGKNIEVKSALNYELASARATNLTVVASDGSCTSQVHYLYVTVTDVNEMPQIDPKGAAYTTYEGSIHVAPSWNVIDPDFTDTKTFTIIGGNDLGRFRIDQSTGEIRSNIDYDVDQNAMPPNVTLTVKVTDKGGLSDNTTVTLIILDANDNRPVIVNQDHDYVAQECYARAGRTLGTMSCTDKDSSFQQNNDLYFGGGGNGLTILESGNIVMNTVPAVGQTITATAYCYDRGQYPNPLQSSGYSVSVTGRDCTTVVVPTKAATTTKAVTTTTTTTAPLTTEAPSTANTKDWLDENLWWIIVAGLIGALLLGLLMYMILIYCWNYCVRWCRQDCCQRRPPQPKSPRTPPRQVKPATPPKTPPAPVVGPQNGYIHDFWKEKYPDTDYGSQPNRMSAPRPVTPPANAPFQNNPGQAAPANKTRTCIIL